MGDATEEVLFAMSSDDAEELNRIIAGQDPAHYAALLSIAKGEGYSPNQRRKALYALGRWHDPAAVPEIVQLLPRLGEDERIAAIDALGRLGTAAGLEAVSRYATDESPRVRETVIAALGRIRSAEAVETLRRIAATDPVEWIRKRAETHVLRLSEAEASAQR
jgi:HEAT repeat protein